MSRDSAASRAMELFGLTEHDYLASRVGMGRSSHDMAAELGLTHVAVSKRLRNYADWRPGGWVFREQREAA